MACWSCFNGLPKSGRKTTAAMSLPPPTVQNKGKIPAMKVHQSGSCNLIEVPKSAVLTVVGFMLGWELHIELPHIQSELGLRCQSWVTSGRLYCCMELTAKTYWNIFVLQLFKPLPKGVSISPNIFSSIEKYVISKNKLFLRLKDSNKVPWTTIFKWTKFGRVLNPPRSGQSTNLCFDDWSSRSQSNPDTLLKNCWTDCFSRAGT